MVVVGVGYPVASVTYLDFACHHGRRVDVDRKMIISDENTDRKQTTSATAPILLLLLCYITVCDCRESRCRLIDEPGDFHTESLDTS